MINTVQWFIVNPVKIRLEIKKKEKMTMQKRNILGILCRTNYRAVYSLRNEPIYFY